MILALRTDRPEASMYLLADGRVHAEYHYEAGRELAKTLLGKLQNFINEYNLRFEDITAVAYYSGAGSFTGLRIGASVANSLAYSLRVKVVKLSGEDWLDGAWEAVELASHGDYPAPEYDRKPNIS